jgi:2-polyprenyl-3-methyl-5-hydroxy-6-metoxy-1,4-benzoquinol methylase
VKHDLEKIEACPICKSESFSLYIKAVDHNVSGDYFSISQCNGCGYRFTNPRPKEKTIGSYYKSEDYVSHSSTKKGLINKIYHVVRAIQFKRKHKEIVSMQKTKGKDLLDVGCGTGDFIKYMRKNGWKADGVETDKQARGLAKKEGSLRIYSSIEDKNLNKYDVITMWHVLEHIYDLDSFLSRIGSLLKKSGVLVVGVPNSNSYDAAYYGENWFAYDLPIHVSHFRKNDIENIFKKHDLKLKSIKPLVFDAYYISMLSEQKSKNSSLFGLVRGFTSNTKAKKSGEYSSLTYYLFK